MADRPSDKTQEEDEYVFSYESDITTRRHASRTADVNAAFFLPYLQSGMSLLDCGCGSGSITLGLAERVAPGEVVGIDIGESESEAASKLAMERGISNARFQVASVYELPFPDGSFDAVFSHNMAEHLSEPQRAFKEMHRVLKPGGVIGVRDTDLGGILISSPSVEIIDQAVEVAIEDWKSVSGDPLIGRRLKPLIREAGFTRVLAFASYETFPTPEALQGGTEILATLFEERNFIERVIKSGLSDQEAMARYSVALREFGKHPDSFLAIAHGEVVGWKN